MSINRRGFSPLGTLRALPRAFRCVAVAGAALVVLQLAAVAGGWGALASPAASTFAAVVIWYGVRTRRPSNPQAWWWIGVFMVSTTIADHLLAADTWLWHRPTPVVGIPDVFYLVGLVALFAGLSAVARARDARGDVEALLDMATVATVAGFLAWQFLIGPTLGDASLSLVDRLVVVAYPIADVVLLAMLVRLIAGGLRAATGGLIAAGLVAWLIADTGFLVSSQAGVSGAWVTVSLNVAWATGAVLFALAALHPSMTTLTQVAETGPVRTLHVWRLVAAIAAFLVPSATEVGYKLAGRELNSEVVLCTSALLGVLIVVRTTRLLPRSRRRGQTRRRPRGVLPGCRDERRRCDDRSRSTGPYFGHGRQHRTRHRISRRHGRSVALGRRASRRP